VKTTERIFRLQFGSAPDARVHAPGRVNLIGEHLDYNGLAVMPMAIGRGISLHFRPRGDDRLRLFNADPRHPPIDLSLSDMMGAASEGWARFVGAAGRSLTRRFDRLEGLDGVVGSDLPAAAGLSSSTALVVAVARALIAVNRLRVDDLSLVEWLAEAERTVGAPGGAMDQAVCVTGRLRVPLKVQFDPLTLTSLHLPDRWRFVVASSLVAADKSGGAEQACRARIDECARALAALRRAGVPGSSSYRELLAACDPEELIALGQHVPCSTVRRRYRHVVGEARRVDAAERSLRDRDIAAFGRLMSDSHRSLRDDFEVSHPQLDRLVELCAAHGALGARLTGAGFGGSVVALCDGSAEGLMDALRREFYASAGPDAREGECLFEV
jgi:galactokinase